VPSTAPGAAACSTDATMDGITIGATTSAVSSHSGAFASR
jgi:hypothetical protein